MTEGKHLEVIRDVDSWRLLRKNIKFKDKTLGFVPTMGAIHEGHMSLLNRSIEENDFTLVSIFLNPTQFNDKRDLESYPKNFEYDLEKLKNTGTNFLLYPSHEELYPDGFRYKIHENQNSHLLCGAGRPGHFDGVLTVVMKLLQIAQADRAYFGEKDYQQYTLVKKMADAFFLKTKIICCPTVREEDGLAMSSRNLLLSEEHRKIAPNFYRLLNSNLPDSEVIKELSSLGFDVEYLESYSGRRFGAVRLGKVRLIDNVSAENII